METFVELRAVITDFPGQMAIARGMEKPLLGKAGTSNFGSLSKAGRIASRAARPGRSPSGSSR